MIYLIPSPKKFSEANINYSVNKEGITCRQKQVKQSRPCLPFNQDCQRDPNPAYRSGNWVSRSGSDLDDGPDTESPGLFPFSHFTLPFSCSRQINTYFKALQKTCCAYNAGDPGSIPGSGRSPGEGNGSLLQYSCLEESMDGRAWQATVHGVAKGLTRLSDFTFFLSENVSTHTYSTESRIPSSQPPLAAVQTAFLSLGPETCPENDRKHAPKSRLRKESHEPGLIHRGSLLPCYSR